MGDVEILFKMAESDEVKGQFLFCPVCRLNHDQGRKHIYTRKHKTLLGKILLKFGKKVSSLEIKDVCIHNSYLGETKITKHIYADRSKYPAYPGVCTFLLSSS